ncbi:hypothetical protein PCE1_004670 [Barthelona sp. PCE]
MKPSSFGSQVGIYFKQDVNLFFNKRRWKAIACQLLAPFIILLIGVILTASFTAFNPFGSLNLDTEATIVGNIPKCNPSLGSCHDFVFSPDTATARALADDIASNNGLTSTLGFDTPADVLTWIKANKNMTQAAYHFTFSGTELTDVTIQVNSSIYECNPNSFYLVCTTNTYRELFLPMQVAVTTEIASGFTVKTRDFPHPALFESMSSSSVAPFFAMMVLVISQVVWALDVVSPKENGITEYYQSSGARRASEFAAHGLFWLLQALVLSIVYILVANLYGSEQANEQNPIVLFIVILAMYITYIPFTLVLVSFLRTAVGAAVACLGSFLFFMMASQILVTFIVGMTVYDDHKIWHNVIMLFVIDPGVQALTLINSAGSAGAPVDVWDSNIHFNVGTSIIYQFISAAIWFVILGLIIMYKGNELGIAGLRRRKPPVAVSKKHKTDEMPSIVAERELVANMSAEEMKKYPVVVKEISKKFDDFEAVRGISFALQENSILGLLGANGQGKSVSFSMTSGTLPITSGEVYLFGKNLAEVDDLRASIGIIPQFNRIYEGLKCSDQLRYLALIKGISKDDVDKEVDRCLEITNSLEFKDKYISDLSGGQKRRIQIAAGFLGDPRLLMADEPTTGLDVDQVANMRNVLLKTGQNRSTIIISHNLEEVDQICQSGRVAIMKTGEFIALGSPSELKAHYGEGYTLYLTMNDINAADTFQNTIADSLPTNLKMESRAGFSMVYRIPVDSQQSIPDLLEAIETNKVAYGVASLSISESSLEDVFLRLVAEEEEEATPSK